MDLKELLNENQYEAATYLDSHLRIIAGAGSGKTRVVTYRIAYLIEKVGVDPRKILAITFTNKAANEMKERIEGVLGPYGTGSLVCTIHSLCVRILRQHIQVIGYPSSFIIMDDEDQKALLKKIYKELQIDTKAISLKSMLHTISIYKMSHITPERAIELAGAFQGELKKAKVYQKYIEAQENKFMLDFDDLLLKTVHIFENYQDVLEKWQHRFQYIHVDEFQDVGDIEYRLVKLMSKHTITCVVGDPDQTIYSFRGANVNYILDFEKDYINTKTIILDRNYRSTNNILSISNSLIRKNTNRLEKELYTTQQNGSQVVHYTGLSDVEEAQYICDRINEIIEKVDGVNYRDFLILYRANYLSRTIEQALIKSQIDYRIFGGLKFFSRKEIKDALCYLRLVALEDDLAFERVVNTPARGIGAKTLENINLVALNYGISMYDAISFHSHEIKFSSKTRAMLANLIQAIEKAKRSSLPMHEMFMELMENVGYMDMLKNDVEDNRIDNIRELENAIHQYSSQNPETATIENYLQDIALYTDNDKIDDGQYVSLMSIHMAKGLESDYVFVVGLSEGVFPSMRAMTEDGDVGLEEERRLAYVAFTRARKQLFLTDCQGHSFITGSPKMSSRFLDEIGKEGVEHYGAKPRFKTSDYVPSISNVDLIGDNKIDDFSIGDLIIHDIFKKGVVVKIQGDTIDIAFELPHGIKTLMKSHQAIKKLTS